MTALRVADYFTTHPILFKPNGEHELDGIVHMSTDDTSPFSYVSLEFIKKFGDKTSLVGDKKQRSFMRHQTVAPTRLALSETDGGVLSFETFYELVLRNKKVGKELFYTNIIMMQNEKCEILSDLLCLEWSNTQLMWILYPCTVGIFLDCSINNQYKVFLMRV